MEVNLKTFDYFNLFHSDFSLFFLLLILAFRYPPKLNCSTWQQVRITPCNTLAVMFYRLYFDECNCKAGFDQKFYVIVNKYKQINLYYFFSLLGHQIPTSTLPVECSSKIFVHDCMLWEHLSP